MPTWPNLYDWPAGHGYVGFGNVGDAHLYDFAAGLGAGPGLWIWPVGAQRYPTGGASWQYQAPGTTRILRATVTLTFPPRLLSHHCVALSFVDAADSERSGSRFCSPPVPPQGSRSTVELTAIDPATTAPMTKELALRIDLPCDDSGACEKFIPAADAVKDGLQIERVDMTLVDDDQPLLSPGGPFWDLRGTYIDGTKVYPLVIGAADAGSGLTQTAFEEPAAAVIETHPTACDRTHHTVTLGSRVCPPTSSIDTNVDTRPMAEGKHEFRETATDVAANTGTSDRWSVFVDRTPPSTPDLAFATPEEGSAQATWPASSDPVLEDGNPGSGLKGYRVRTRIAEGSWGDWQAVGAESNAGDEVFDQPAGTSVSFEVASFDAVGNVSLVASAAGQVPGEAPAMYTSGPLAEAADGFLPAGPFAADVSADDGDGAGVRILGLEVDGSTVATADAGCTPRTLSDGRPWKAICPSAAASTLSVDTTTLAEGRHNVVAFATDRAGNRATRAWAMVVDKGAPAVPDGSFTAVFNDETNETDVFWPEAVDAPLGDGSAGSGVAGYDVRYRRDGQPWSDWKQTETETFTVGDSYEGEKISVEVRTRDGAGNLSDTTSGVATAAVSSNGVQVDFVGLDSQPELAPLGRSGLMLEAKSGKALDIVVQCRIGDVGAGIPTLLDEYAGEHRIAVHTDISGYCYPTQDTKEAAAAYAGMTLQLRICLEVSDDRSFPKGSVETIKCDALRSKRRPNERSPLSVETAQLCRPGGTYYRTRVGERSSSPGFVSSHGTGYSDAFWLGCNEAGAWRREASRNGDPGQILGNALLSPFSAPIDQDDLPQSSVGGKRRGWEAHHVVPKEYGRGTTSRDVAAARIQALAYTCDIDPNSALNGVWLRGPQLYGGTPGYASLSEYGKRRPAHQPIHTTAHFAWVGTYLDNHATSSGTCLSRGGMFDSIRRMKEIIRAGDAPQ